MKILIIPQKKEFLNLFNKIEIELENIYKEIAVTLREEEKAKYKLWFEIEIGDTIFIDKKFNEGEIIMRLKNLNNKYEELPKLFLVESPESQHAGLKFYGNGTQAFIHFGEIEEMNEAERHYWIMHQLLVFTLINSSLKLESIVPHKNPKGCINDYSNSTREIRLKMKSADICPDCWISLSTQIDMYILISAQRYLESIRIKILDYYQMLLQEKSPVLEYNDGTFYVNNKNIILPAREKAFFRLFFENQRKIHKMDLEDHIEEFRKYYLQYSTKSNRIKQEVTIKNMTKTGPINDVIDKIHNELLKTKELDNPIHIDYCRIRGNPKHADDTKYYVKAWLRNEPKET